MEAVVALKVIDSPLKSSDRALTCADRTKLLELDPLQSDAPEVACFKKSMFELV
jgi:hypothetical protein